jgi:hypothetical protein
MNTFTQLAQTVILSTPVLCYVAYRNRITLFTTACVLYMQCKRIWCPTKQTKKVIIDISHSLENKASCKLFPHIEEVECTYVNKTRGLPKVHIEESIYKMLQESTVLYNKGCSLEHTDQFTTNLYRILYEQSTRQGHFPNRIRVTLNTSLLGMLNKCVPMQHTNGVIVLDTDTDQTIRVG